ncbi:MAG: bifunctional phosphoribosylaminoimidazolecarboxamide formyltransferase/IMP cyclohydrolase [Lachnospirales bacterium]
MNKRALISVADKSGIVEFGKKLVELGFDIVSTGNTKKTFEENGIETLGISDLTNFPEILGGRVKTLHPSVHGAILCDYDIPEHLDTLKDLDINKIDLVCVNLYPFEENLKANKDHATLIEKIDIGGPTMVRAAAKNYKHIIVCSDPSQYNFVLENLENNGDLSYEQREVLAREAFSLIAHYDNVIDSYFLSRAENDELSKFKMTFASEEELRYGLNPFQKSKLYFDELPINQLQGKKLSYNNLLDIDAILKMAKDFNENVCIAVKHLNPCGIAFGETVLESYVNAHACDSVSIFGGIVCLKKEIDKDTALEMNKIFLEVVLAPSFTDEALEVFSKKKNLRVLTYELKENKVEARTVLGGILVQEVDNKILVKEDAKVVTKKQINDNILEEMIFADTVCKHVMSNAIVVTKDNKTVGVGVGQTNRIQSAKIALEQAKEKGVTEGLVLASDAFFPFDDTVRFAKEYGVEYIVQPGGSIKDEEVIKACDELDIAMVFTGNRHFKH